MNLLDVVLEITKEITEAKCAVRIINNVMKNCNVSIEKACRVLGVTQEEYMQYMETLQRIS